MEVKSIIFIVGTYWIVMVKITMAHLDLPLCEKQSDLTGYVSRILKQTTNLSSVVKREDDYGWVLNCLHASIIKDENDEAYFSYTIYACCIACEFPNYHQCVLEGKPGWLCASEAYDCVFSCRDEASVLEAVHKAGDGDRKRRLPDINVNEAKKLKMELRKLRRENQCYQRKCTVRNRERQCCLVETCVAMDKFKNSAARKITGKS